MQQTAIARTGTARWTGYEEELRWRHVGHAHTGKGAPRPGGKLSTLAQERAVHILDLIDAKWPTTSDVRS